MSGIHEGKVECGLLGGCIPTCSCGWTGPQEDTSPAAVEAILVHYEKVGLDK